MSRVLFVAYCFPPIGGAGVQRNARFVRRLPALGHEPVVLTGPGGTTSRWSPADDTLVAKLPADVAIHRIAGPEPPPSTGNRERAERWLGVDQPVMRWWIDGAVELGKEVGRGCDLIYVSAVPYESAEIGARLSAELGIPWVADLQDPWALDEMWVYPTRWHRGVDLARMRRMLGSADGIVMNTPEASARLLGAFPELESRRVVSITNGFDANDFDAQVAPRADDAFRIVHTGSLHTDRGRKHRRTSIAKRVLGGTAMNVDILTRSVVYLLEALDRLAAAEPELAAPIELHLAGVMSAGDNEVAGRSTRVNVHGYLSHSDTLALMRTADLLFLPMQDLPPGTRAGLTPGKTYEYLASGRPILAAVPDGDARELLAAAGTALIVRPRDVQGMANAIARQVRCARGGHPGIAVRDDVVARYECGRLSEDLAELFEALLVPRPARRAIEPHAVPATS